MFRDAINSISTLVTLMKAINNEGRSYKHSDNNFLNHEYRVKEISYFMLIFFVNVIIFIMKHSLIRASTNSNNCKYVKNVTDLRSFCLLLFVYTSRTIEGGAS